MKAACLMCHFLESYDPRLVYFVGFLEVPVTLLANTIRSSLFCRIPLVLPNVWMWVYICFHQLVD